MGGFTSGFSPKIFDFAGHRLRKRELALKERALDLKEGKTKAAKDEEMKQSPVPVRQINPQFADKFKPGQEELLRQIDAYAAANANELNHKNTSTDNIEGEFNPEKWSTYQNMLNNLQNFAQHSNDYVTNYSNYFDQVYELDEFDNNVYNLDMVSQDPVFLTREMLTKNMGEGETEDDYTWMWNADGSANTDGEGQQTAAKNSDGNYVWEQSDDGQEYLIGENGERLTAYSQSIIDGSIKQTPSGIYTFERIFNEEYNSDLLKFDSTGNIVYGDEGSEIPYYQQWDKNFTKLDKHKYSTDGIWEIANGLVYSSSPLDEITGSYNQYLTSGSMDDMRRQLQGTPGESDGVAVWNTTTNDWNSQYGNIASRMVAESILKEQGNSNPTSTQIDNVVEKIKSGEKSMLPENMQKSSKYGSKPKIETYEDYFVNKILERWETKHPDINIAPPRATGPGSLGSDIDWNTTLVQPKQIQIGPNEFAVNDAANVSAVPKDFKIKPRDWQTTRRDADGNVTINSYQDVGFVAFDPDLTAVLQKGGSKGDLTATQFSHRAIDKRTGQLMLNAEYDAQGGRFIFASEEDAKNAIIVAGFEGYWKPKDPDAIRNNITYDDEGLLTEEHKDADLFELLKNKKGIEGFFPLNPGTLSGDQLKGLPTKYIDKATEIKKIIKTDGGEIREFAMNDQGDSIIQDTEWAFPGSEGVQTA